MLNMVNDRQITITTGSSRRAVQWTPQLMRLSEFYERLGLPARSEETLAEYLNLPKGPAG